MISSKGLPGFFIFDRKKGKETWIVERQREREHVREAEHTEVGSVIKPTVRA